jgi:predicted nucleic acid-binding protein
VSVTVVVDSNVLVALTIPLEYSEPSLGKIDFWLSTGVDMVAPALWSYEATSAVRKYVYSGKLTQEEAFSAISDLLEIGIRDIEPTQELHRKALEWAERLGDVVAYDPAYLALAEQLDVVFWTADAKLVTKVQALGIDWVHHISAPV